MSQPPDSKKRARLRSFLYSFHRVPQGEYWPLYDGKNHIGRNDACEVEQVLIDDPTISSQHAVIELDDSGCTLRDAGSTNGTYVNDLHVGYEGTCTLCDNARIRFGAYQAVVHLIAK